ncbi:MAG TPA: Gfo/Idh/MocA family oxidoreductase [Chthonomonadales bacterium]|nr:Gfo/Idh/MocA family oxidoreductase [Chthonomonadales bacterium]
MINAGERALDAEPLQLGIVGSPAARQRYRNALSQCRLAQLAGVVDPDLRAARAWARQLGGSISTSLDLAGLFEARPAVSAILIAVDLPDRIGLITEALAAGRSALCEFPFTLTAAEAEHATDQARQSGLVLMPVFPRRLDPELQTVRNWIDAGLLGDIRQVRCQWRFASAESFSPEDGVSPGAPGWDRLTQAAAYHSIDVCRWWLGEVAAVSADTEAILGQDEESTGDGGPVNLILSHERGPSTHHFSKSRSARADERYSISGSLGHAALCSRPAAAGSAPLEIEATLYNGKSPPDPSEETDRIHGRLAALLDHFAACVMGDAHPFLDAEDGCAVQEIVRAAHISSRTTSKVSVPLQRR